jgi:hypothetical protein
MRRIALSVLGVVLAMPSLGQVSRPTPKDLETAPVQFRAEVTGDPSQATVEQRIAPPGMKPTTGARDFTGAYTTAERAGSGIPPTGAAPSSGRPGGPPSGAAPSYDAASTAQTANRGCVPDMYVGIASPTHVVTGRDVIVLVREGGHKVRRIYLDGEHPKNLPPSIFGHSIGRFDGDTLVVETVGLKSGLTLVERIRKVDGGRLVETTANGVAMLANWRPDLRYVEDICEDAGELFGPQYATKGLQSKDAAP